MTVAELIEELKKHSPLLPVRVDVTSSDDEGNVYVLVEDVKDATFHGNHIRLETD